MSLAEKIRQAREETGLSQLDLALKVGCSERTVQRWEAGARPMDVYLRLVAVVTGKPMEWFCEEHE